MKEDHYTYAVRAAVTVAVSHGATLSAGLCDEMADVIEAAEELADDYPDGDEAAAARLRAMVESER
jgi:hypothetical protein